MVGYGWMRPERAVQMAEVVNGGVRRAAEMVDELTGDTEALFTQVAEQLEGTIGRNERLRDGLQEQLARLDELLAYQRQQLSAVRSAAEHIPRPAVSSEAPAAAVEDIDLGVDPGDTEAGLGDRILVLLARKPRTTIDELVADLRAAGDEAASRRGVATAITNLGRAGKVERDDEQVTLVG